jgi:hypothetical protein
MKPTNLPSSNAKIKIDGLVKGSGPFGPEALYDPALCAPK